MSQSFDSDILCKRDKLSTLVEWHTESLAQYLKVVVAQQMASRKMKDSDTLLSSAETTMLENKKAPIEEMTDKIAFPFIENLEQVQMAADAIKLDQKVKAQLRSFVSEIAAT